MLSRADQYTLSLSPSELILIRSRNGKAVQTERCWTDVSQWDEAWSGGLHQFDQPLRQLLARFGSPKLRDVTVLYTSPSSVCRVECADQHPETMVMRLRSQLAQSLGCAASVDTAALVQGTEDESASVVYGATDSEAALQKLYAWLRRADIDPGVMIPHHAETVLQGVQVAQQADPGTAVLLINRSSSVIAFWNEGIPAIVRLSGIGLDAIIDVYAKHATETDKSEETDEQPKSAAFAAELGVSLAFEHGIPLTQSSAPDEIRSLMPRIVPVLQRLAIEIKQTLRFAGTDCPVPERILIAGLGAAVPGLSSALESSLDIPVDSDQAHTNHLASMGIDAHPCLFGSAGELGLLPRASKEIKQTKKLMVSVRVGAVIAGVVLAGQFFNQSRSIKQAEQVIASQADQVSQIERERTSREQTSVLASSIGAAAELADENVRVVPPWDHFLASIPSNEDGMIRVNEISGRIAAHSPEVKLTGVVVQSHSTAEHSNKVLSRYIESLRAIDCVRRVEIASTSRVSIGTGESGTSFQIMIELEELTPPIVKLSEIGNHKDEVLP